MPVDNGGYAAINVPEMTNQISADQIKKHPDKILLRFE